MMFARNLISTRFPASNESITTDWLITDSCVRVKFNHQATTSHLAQMFDALDTVVDQWATHQQFHIFMDTRNPFGKPQWNSLIRERSLSVVKLAMSRGLVVRAALIVEDAFVRQLVQLFFTGIQPFTMHYRLKIAFFENEMQAIEWLRKQQTNAFTAN